MDQDTPSVDLLDCAPTVSTFYEEIVTGLRRTPPRLPCKYFYDQRGSQLFDQICEQDEYYLTDADLEIMRRYAPQMAEQIGPGVMLVEYGSGSSSKTRLLLDHLQDAVAYVPVDISRAHLQQTANTLSAAYRHIEILPVCADFTQPFELPTASQKPTHAAVFFPGSTIGNFPPDEVRRLLNQIATLCGSGGGLLIGIDLKKDVATLEAAYNDQQGVTAEFNLNLLERINRELEADFQPDHFRHDATYNDDQGRIEMYLVSQRAQSVSIGEETFEFDQGDKICTEYPHKYTVAEFAEIAAGVGLTLRRQWTDRQNLFAVLHFARMN